MLLCIHAAVHACCCAYMLLCMLCMLLTCCRACRCACRCECYCACYCACLCGCCCACCCAYLRECCAALPLCRSVALLPCIHSGGQNAHVRPLGSATLSCTPPLVLKARGAPPQLARCQPTMHLAARLSHSVLRAAAGAQLVLGRSPRSPWSSPTQ